jgi:hypothetical protein
MPTVAILVWPLVALVLFRALGQVRGVIWATLVGALFLPEAFSMDVPGLPPYDKNAAIALGLLAGMWLTRRDAAALPQRGGWDTGLLTALAALFVLSPVLTVLNNRAPLVYGPTVIPGLGLRDLITMCSQSLILLIPFLAARRHLAGPDSHRLMLEAFVAAGIGYSVLVLFEVRMSPQLHTWVYGYFQHTWNQHIRGGGFRPIVFQPHGLWIGIFLLTCAMAAFALLRVEGRTARSRIWLAMAGLGLVAVLFLSRNFGSAALALVFLPILWLWRSRTQVRLATVVVIALMVFPALRQAGLVPLQSVLEFTGDISASRQSSLMVRIVNEDAFLARARLKPVSGWGVWARWRIWDAETGEDVSTSDGRWISILGERGWIGYVAYFGVLSLAVVFLTRAAQGQLMPAATAGVAVIIAATLLYQIPNNTVGPMTMLLAGSLAGFVRHGVGAPAAVATAAGMPSMAATARAQPRYTRFPDGGGTGHATRNRQPQAGGQDTRMPRA